MRNLHNNQGSAIVFALMAIVLVGTLAAATFSRTIFTEQKSGEAKQKDRADLGADAALQLAIRKVQRLGSATFDERTCSILDGPRDPNPGLANYDCSDTNKIPPKATSVQGFLNGIDTKDGSYNFIIRGGGADNAGTPDVDERFQREITAYGYYNGRVKKRTLRFMIVPRVFRYALYAGGATGAPAINLGANSRLYLPPAYKTAEKSRGGDVGANQAITFQANARVNERSAATVFYDKLFLPTGATASTAATPGFYGGRPWGTLTRSRPGNSAYEVQYPAGTSVEAANPDFPTSDSRINLDGDIRNLSGDTTLPIYSNIMFDFRTIASNNLANRPEGSIYTPAEFQTLLAGNSAHTLSGMVYIDNRTGGTCTITTAGVSSLTILNGGLVLHGCNLDVANTTSLRITHSLANRASVTHTYPGLLVARNSADIGGTATFRSSNTFYTSIDGVTLTEGNLNITSSLAAPSNGSRGNFNANGSVVVGGRFNTTNTGAGSAILRWNPLAQNMRFDPSTGRMGTYTIKTDDRPPPNIPSVVIDNASKPTNPTQNNFADFSWTITGEYDSVEYRLVGGTSDPAWMDPITTPSTADSENNAGMTGLSPYTDYTFEVQVCNLSGCDVDSYTWRVNPPPATVSISSGPAQPTTRHDATFNWDTVGIVETTTCKIDNGAFASCAKPFAFGTNPYPHPSYLTHGAHSLIVKVCNVSGCNDSAAYNWIVNTLPVPTPVITPASKPADPSSYTATGANFTWALAGPTEAIADEVSCQIDGGAWVACSGSRAYSRLSTNTTHTFRVRACGESGCNIDEHQWFINPTPPTVSLVSTPPNPQVHTSRSWNFTWTKSSTTATTDCRIDGGAWFVCGTAYPATYTGCANHTFDVRVTNVSGTQTDSYTWHVNCPPPTISFTSTPGDFYFSSGTYNYNTTNASSCTATYWAGASGCALNAFNVGGKPYGTNTMQICVYNADATASACASDSWNRANTNVPNGFFDDGSFWNNWYVSDLTAACCPGNYRTARSESIGTGVHTSYSAVSLRTFNGLSAGWNNTWTGVTNASIYGRGDDIRFAMRNDFYGASRLGTSAIWYQYYNGSSWVIATSAGVNASSGWRWARLEGRKGGGLGYTRAVSFFARASSTDNCNPSGYGYGGGCGGQYDTTSGIGSEIGVTGLTDR